MTAFIKYLQENFPEEERKGGYTIAGSSEDVEIRKIGIYKPLERLVIEGITARTFFDVPHQTNIARLSGTGYKEGTLIIGIQEPAHRICVELTEERRVFIDLTRRGRRQPNEKETQRYTTFLKSYFATTEN